MNYNSFAYRHIGIRKDDEAEMLREIGVSSLDELILKTVPENIRIKPLEGLDAPKTERTFLTHLKKIAAKNKLFRNYIGMGYYGTVLPGVIQRNIFENPGWYTAYTPYQAEIAQGRMEMLLNYQTMVCDLTGMEIANASLLDEATAAAEAMTMLHSARTKEKQNSHKLFVSDSVFPQTKALLKTRAIPLGIELEFGDFRTFKPRDEYYAVLVQYPDANGEIQDYRTFVNECKAHGIHVIVAADILSLALLTPPGEWGADVVVGTTQRFGIPLGFGGPHAAYFATKDEYKRFIPGRIIGRTIDKDGKPALRMALQTREQHIKREKATSNICTAQVLLAVMAAAYAIYHGPDGLRHIARRIHHNAIRLASSIDALGYKQLNKSYFDTIRIDLGEVEISKLRQIAERNMMNFNYIDSKTLSISLGEATYDESLEDIVRVFAEAKGVSPVSLPGEVETTMPEDLLRTSPFLTHPVFNSYHSETEMMRYLKKLERKDLALNQSMIALGSCTMKLNAATEMIPLSWPEFSDIHPFAPADQVEGYMHIIRELERDLAIITGFDSVSLQPNSGAQGEYAGLMVIRAYHQHRGQGHRNVVLIPSSAHGTNPASAVMAGMKVVVVKCDENGNIDVNDLRSLAEKHSNELAGLMITYPSTHGVFESAVKEITDIIHTHGGQVYMDGANMNAQVGLTNPAAIGADVCHLNLHKTFAIPHGGGGPGMGPICVAKHLAPFLPGHPIVKTGGEHAITPISAAPYGSGLILIISYAYIKMLGAEGLTNATKYAILNANYIKARLEKHYPILYTGENGTVAHELILDCRAFKRDASIEVVDIAKRLMDYGFHAPTVSFPVAGTLMIEPTESESKAEIDRFCDAMISIRKEIEEIALGNADKINNVLKNAPHTLEMLTAEEWSLPYTRKKAAYPLDYVAENKFWPSVRRVDDAYGDRNLVCTCEPTSSYAE
ncbi:glycine dehydrogenase (aminomethyl-transferring) [Thermaurantimonas aggregans]|uniref:Glycine dehydrogenase (decarboxylating) n=1 Tax=Thermaurantimonas aggregans TaxID=2173829 RepID=A0A401XIR2_9FLAO|nr:aminomethyl-transferring glycine dehydrogenase [Thermaurantimonas aggregans]MCX8149804.1 aminomethyl-transferring glycine dehydrogenase [Thermaurantimonas aggregans]GCD76915.1 glycine dehydrogenase (aminomethyl-transferring) [Thermaurantimonas aggregans]